MALHTRMFILAMRAGMAVLALPVEIAFLIEVLVDLIRLRSGHIPWQKSIALRWSKKSQALPRLYVM